MRAGLGSGAVFCRQVPFFNCLELSLLGKIPCVPLLDIFPVMETQHAVDLSSPEHSPSGPQVHWLMIKAPPSWFGLQ